MSKECVNARHPSGLVGNLHNSWCGSREFDSYRTRFVFFLR